MSQFRYQHRGYAKYTDIARLFGWRALRDFHRQEHRDYMRGTPDDGLDPIDSRILRLSVAAGADLTPLIHFWGIHPVHPTELRQALAEQNVPPSAAVRELLERYMSIAPRNNAEFNDHYEALYPGRPAGDNPNNGVGWYNAWRDRFDETHAAEIRQQVQHVIDLYF